MYENHEGLVMKKFSAGADVRADPMEKEDTGEKPVPSLLACIQVADHTINLPLPDSSS